MNINIVKLIVIGCVIVVIVILLVLFSPWLLLMIGGNLSFNPPTPQITHGEFPFRLEYEIDGQNFVLEDTLICDFDGYGFSEGTGGKFRKWKSRLESGKTRITLLTVDGIEIYYFPIKPDSRLAGVYMGDIEFYSGGTGGTFPDAWRTSNFEDKTVNDYIVKADEMLKKYKLKIISWEPSLPIQNIFK